MANLPPAYLFVVRHGNRLDAADKKWHLTSPTPYDPPLTYGGFLQARQVGNQIMAILEQAKMEAQAATTNPRRRRFKVVIHSSPFLRCVQTSIGLGSGLAQTSPDSPYAPADVILPRAAPTSNPLSFKSALLRIDSFLGEWLSPEYFEMITPPPGPALMLGGAKADLLRREDYSAYATAVPQRPPAAPSRSLWQASPSPLASPANVPPSPSSSDGSGALSLSALTSSLPPLRSADCRGFVPFRPMYAVSSSGKIPEGFVAHARDSCITVDFQWDSMRAPLDFGDGGTLGEEWTAMHKRFRRGLEKLVNWYATADSPADVVAQAQDAEAADEDIETVVILVSHGAGCNALIGAITHQPVLMDVGIASITMATRKSRTAYACAVAARKSSAGAGKQPPPLVRVDEVYDMRLSASTEHLHSTSSTPVSSRSASHANMRSVSINGSRGRTSTLGSCSVAAPAMSSYVLSDALSALGGRSTSASAATVRRDSSFQRALARNVAAEPPPPPSVVAPTSGLWSPMPSSLRLMDDAASDKTDDDLASVLPDFDQKRFEAHAKPVQWTLGSDGRDDPFAASFSSAAASGCLSSAVPSGSFSSAAASASFSSAVPSGSFSSAAPSTPFSSTAPSTSLSSSPSSRHHPPPPPHGPVLAAPIKLQTSLAPQQAIEEVNMSCFGGGLGGLWGLPPPPDEAERFRDLSQTKRRWTVNERV